MKAVCGENYLEINLSGGVVFHTTPSHLTSDPEHRILPFSMIKNKEGNWAEVRRWFKEKMGWKLDFYTEGPIDIDKELASIRSFLSSAFHPSLARRRRLHE